MLLPSNSEWDGSLLLERYSLTPTYMCGLHDETCVHVLHPTGYHPPRAKGKLTQGRPGWVYLCSPKSKLLQRVSKERQEENEA